MQREMISSIYLEKCQAALLNDMPSSKQAEADKPGDRQIVSADKLIPLSDYLALLKWAVRYYDPYRLGFCAGRNTSIAEHGLIGYAILSANDLETVIARYCRFAPQLAGLVRMKLDKIGNKARVVGRFMRRYRLNEAVRSYLFMETLAHWQSLGPSIGSHENWIHSIDVPFDQHTDAEDLEPLVGCKINWGAEELAINFPAFLLSHRVRYENLLLDDAYLQSCETILSGLEKGQRWTAEINRLLSIHSGTLPKITDMASLLNTSQRSLRRRLKDEGSNYRKITTQFRMTLAKLYMQKTTLSASEIGTLVGYTEPANFFRAYRLYFDHGTSQAD